MGHKNSLQIKFLGAAGTVTGSRTLVTFNNYRLLIDCGLFQGPKTIRERNWQPFAEASQIDAVLLTHAHIDHSGYIPKLVKEGFAGPVYASAGTVDLCRILLIDSAHLQEEDARYLNKKKATHYHPAKPLYTVKDAEKALNLLKAVAKEEWIELTKGLSFRLLRSGHILGSTFVQLTIDDGNGQKILTCSGDLGHNRQHVIRGPVTIKESDYLVLESTYGDRLQPKMDTLTELETIINKTFQRGGVVVIPSFAVGRTQELLYLIARLEREKRIPHLPVYVDSPMANNATEIYLKYRDELKLSLQHDKFEYPINPNQFKAVSTVDESMMVTMMDGPFIVISAAGMLTGGRVLHHLRKRLPDPKNSVIFVGYQVEETKGRLLQQGLPKIRIHKQLIDVEAEIYSISTLSAHGDSQDLVDWVERMNKKPEKIFLNHGEPAALNAL
ncbi:MAG: MBL fold metallo-hydrolase, partial [Bdellovibrionales bacterium]|nr:MBL fold metallo-hydrolase [Bdellovibrionales bacterium]